MKASVYDLKLLLLVVHDNLPCTNEEWKSSAAEYNSKSTSGYETTALKFRSYFTSLCSSKKRMRYDTVTIEGRPALEVIAEKLDNKRKAKNSHTSVDEKLLLALARQFLPVTMEEWYHVGIVYQSRTGEMHKRSYFVLYAALNRCGPTHLMERLQRKRDALLVDTLSTTLSSLPPTDGVQANECSKDVPETVTNVNKRLRLSDIGLTEATMNMDENIDTAEFEDNEVEEEEEVERMIFAEIVSEYNVMDFL